MLATQCVTICVTMWSPPSRTSWESPGRPAARLSPSHAYRVRLTRKRRSCSASNLGKGLRPLCLVGVAGGSCPQLAGFGEASGDLPQLQVQILRGASQQIESVLRGDLKPLHQDSFGLADDISRQQSLRQITAKALKGAWAISSERLDPALPATPSPCPRWASPDARRAATTASTTRGLTSLTCRPASTGLSAPSARLSQAADRVVCEPEHVPQHARLLHPHR
jgi:hypothetical protein